MRQAVILAADEGQRLRPFTVTKPKVMLSIAGKPILQYIVEALAENGIRNIVIVVGYRKEQIYDYFGNGERFGVEIVYITQPRQLGTADALALVKNVSGDEFLVLPGDNLIEAETIAGFVEMKPNAILVKKTEKPSRYGVVTVEGGTVKEIMEKPKETRSDMVNTGIYSLNRDIFNFIGEELSIPDVINGMVTRGPRIAALETSSTWLDVVYPWDIVSLNSAILRKLKTNLSGNIESGVTIRGLVSVGEDTKIRANSYIIGPVVIGKNCDLGPNVCISPSTSLGNNVVISPFTEIKNSVISDDVHIGTGSIIEDSVIDKGCVIKGHFTASSGEAEITIEEEYHRVNIGAMLGGGCNVGNNVITEPGVIVGNYSRINRMKVIRGKLPDRSLVL